MATCPNGHRNPARWEFCNECGEPIDDSGKPWALAWRRSGTRVLLAVGCAALVTGVGAAVLIARNGEQAKPTGVEAASSAVAEWWSASNDDVSGFAAALHDSNRAIELQDAGALMKACQQLHETAGIRVPAHLPTPDPELTSELQAAVMDAHEASHMCLAAAAGSMNSYRGEFAADMEQADKHLAAAQEIVDRAVPKRGFARSVGSRAH